MFSAAIVLSQTSVAGQGIGAGVACMEDFANVESLTTKGWSIVSNSQPLGTTIWHQGASDVFPALDGDADSYAAADEDATSGTPSLISTWLVTPKVDFGPNEFSAKILSFHTRAQPGSANRLVVRQCEIMDGENCDVPADGFGGFTTVLLDINPDLLADGYPSEWAQYDATPADGLLVAGFGRIAFHYYLLSQPDGRHGSYIGIDSAGIAGATSCPFIEVMFQGDFD